MYRTGLTSLKPNRSIPNEWKREIKNPAFRSSTARMSKKVF